jgi:hypothetical protein
MVAILVIVLGLITYLVYIKVTAEKDYPTYAKCVNSTKLPCVHFFIYDMGQAWEASPYRSKEECDQAQQVVGFTCVIPPGDFKEVRWINGADLERAEKE